MLAIAVYAQKPAAITTGPKKGSLVIGGGGGIPQSIVRGVREGNQIMMAKGYEIGMGFLTNAAIDQHIDTRKRENDMAEVIAAHSELIGIGLYESTAIVAQGDKFEVIGDGKVAITDGKERDGKKYYLLAPGDRFNLKARAKL